MNKDRVSLTTIQKLSLIIHGMLSGTSFPSFMVYSSWIIMVDFNCIMYSYKKKLEETLLRSPNCRTLVFVKDYGLIDLRIIELYFTWSNQVIDSLIRTRIDIVLCNILCLDSSLDSHYKATFPLSSNHSSLIVYIYK